MDRGKNINLQRAELEEHMCKGSTVVSSESGRVVVTRRIAGEVKLRFSPRSSSAGSAKVSTVE